MTYFFDTEQRAPRDDVRRFAERDVRPLIAAMEARRAVEFDLPREIATRS